MVRIEASEELYTRPNESGLNAWKLDRETADSREVHRFSTFQPQVGGVIVLVLYNGRIGHELESVVIDKAWICIVIDGRLDGSFSVHQQGFEKIGNWVWRTLISSRRWRRCQATMSLPTLHS